MKWKIVAPIAVLLGITVAVAIGWMGGRLVVYDVATNSAGTLAIATTVKGRAEVWLTNDGANWSLNLKTHEYIDTMAFDQDGRLWYVRGPSWLEATGLRRYAPSTGETVAMTDGRLDGFPSPLADGRIAFLRAKNTRPYSMGGAVRDNFELVTIDGRGGGPKPVSGAPLFKTPVQLVSIAGTSSAIVRHGWRSELVDCAVNTIRQLALPAEDLSIHDARGKGGRRAEVLFSRRVTPVFVLWVAEFSLDRPDKVKYLGPVHRTYEYIRDAGFAGHEGFVVLESNTGFWGLGSEVWRIRSDGSRTRVTLPTTFRPR